MRTLIVGGPAGTTAAIALAHAGIEVGESPGPP